MGLDLEGIMLDEKSQKKKDKYCMLSLIWESKKKQTHKENKLVVARKER